MDRRSVLKTAAALAAYGLPVPALLTSRLAQGKPIGESKRFDYAWLKGHARDLASKPFKSHEGELPKSLQKLSWDDYQAIRFRPEKSLWQDDGSAFRAQLFHLGLYFQTPVHIFEVIDGEARELAYDPDYFEYDGKQPLGDLPDDLGYAGFRVQFHTNYKLDLAAFLGASYFRAVGKDMQYGMSARGLAIDTATDHDEEFPTFTAFWLEKPSDGSGKLTVYALLDSPSITGAYVFDIYPGRNMVMNIGAALYPRKEIERLGIAPLTSMYQVGENHNRVSYDWRPEIHDSDGLAMWTGGGEWLWRPLVNPHYVRVNSFSDNNPKGFGLLQRDRDFDHYQDDGVFYEKRPSVWVNPSEEWGKGAVMLVEIPTEDETFDNIVAFWKPEKPLAVGKEHLFSYKLTWGERAPDSPRELATTRATRTGLGGVVGQKREYFSWRFAIDFAGGVLGMLGDDAEIEAVIVASRGKVEITSARPLASINGYRAMFDLVPDDTETPIDLRVYLKLGDQPLTETWLYQYTPPPTDKRKLF
ncbi:MAG: glucan biosynthesis protein D [Alteromonadaceae bacterium]|uniref:glucan biosynthesis protein n=1 Tax=unclassified Marinobacter TaxID=83889 RepID=UPI000C504C2C|nr:glucan biosynthesis protein D [Marinobacter sp. BGYM27]MAA66242.1 glucan biosynthesis protein D [Alteromonadaceae bacterium]MBH87316.1 glucan biosynthesis protein D [Alteromonadaceae bacterium]MDG5498989.1 glucan biosynthesis protein D [Marinobacter sp. BGYM27]|tara:strand:- start:59092 stop:60675 length:1584 start_codon:yes stop_codon:yes gene_type:complete